MQHTHDTDEEFTKTTAPQGAGVADTTSDATSPRDPGALLHNAAELAAAMGVDLDTWMKEAWSAYVDARPGLREHIEDMQLIAQIAALRQSGRIGQA
jgi:hypothetical protein